VELTGAAAAARIVIESERCEPSHQRLQRVFGQSADGLYRYIVVRVGGDRHAADDLIQQVCYEAARKRAVPLDDAQCEAWLFGIARNRIRKHWRRLRRRGVQLVGEDATVAGELVAAMEKGPLPPEVLSKRESIAQLMLAITALPAADQQILFAFYFDGRPQQAIAAERGLTAKSVETRLYRVRSRLRAILSENQRGEP